VALVDIVFDFLDNLVDFLGNLADFLGNLEEVLGNLEEVHNDFLGYFELEVHHMDYDLKVHHIVFQRVDFDLFWFSKSKLRKIL